MDRDDFFGWWDDLDDAIDAEMVSDGVEVAGGGREGNQTPTRVPVYVSPSDATASAHGVDKREKDQDLRHKDETHAARMSMVWVVAKIVASWMMAVMFTVWLVGYRRFYLSDDVMKWLLGTSTSTVLGTFFIVLRYLFPKGSKRPG